MNESLITVRYVKALFELAREKNITPKIREDMDMLLECIQDSPEFVNFLHNPLIKISEKSRLITEIFGTKVQEVTLQFLLLLVTNKREVHLKDMAHYYISYYKASQGIKEALLTTAHPLDAAHTQEIHDFITKKFKVTIDLKKEVDPEIIGGFILRIEDLQVNASMKAQLNKIQRELTQ